MSGYENVVAGKLKLKGKPLDVKGGEIGRKKKKHKKDGELQLHQLSMNNASTELLTYSRPEANDGKEISVDTGKGQVSRLPAHLTPAERRYLEQWEKIDMKRLAKNASKSHRDKIQEFNQYLANLSEHYDIPKVGPG